jgi:hypothetical protein
VNHFASPKKKLGQYHAKQLELHRTFFDSFLLPVFFINEKKDENKTAPVSKKNMATSHETLFFIAVCRVDGLISIKKRFHIHSMETKT